MGPSNSQYESIIDLCISVSTRDLCSSGLILDMSDPEYCLKAVLLMTTQVVGPQARPSRR